MSKWDWMADMREAMRRDVECQEEKAESNLGRAQHADEDYQKVAAREKGCGGYGGKRERHELEA